MNILITGGCGHVGSHLVVPLVERGAKITLFDLHGEPTIRSAAHARCEFVKGDLSREEDVMQALASRPFDVVFHLGGILSAKAEEDIRSALRINVNGTVYILEAAHKYGVKMVVFASTVATYGGDLPDPVLTAMLASWPKRLDDSAAVRDWGWHPTYDLEAMTCEMIKIIQTNHGEATFQHPR